MSLCHVWKCVHCFISKMDPLLSKCEMSCNICNINIQNIIICANNGQQVVKRSNIGLVHYLIEALGKWQIPTLVTKCGIYGKYHSKNNNIFLRSYVKLHLQLGKKSKPAFQTYVELTQQKFNKHTCLGQKKGERII